MAQRIGRRSFLARVTGGAVIAGGVFSFAARSTRAQERDRDATDPSRGNGITDRDANDSAGFGRGNNSGFTDRDPTDRAGNGRGGFGSSDRDPTDQAGHGRTSDNSAECADLRRQMAELEGSSGGNMSDEDFRRLENDREVISHLAEENPEEAPGQRRMAVIAERWGVTCEPTDTRCMAAGVEAQWQAESQARLRRRRDIGLLRRRMESRECF